MHHSAMDDRNFTTPQFTRVANVDDVPEGAVLPIEAGGKAILLCRSDDRIFAVAQRCSHADESLLCGRIRHGWIVCPAHGARFDLATGEPLNPPATTPLATYATRIVGGGIEVLV